jgi:hypothetical protein
MWTIPVRRLVLAAILILSSSTAFAQGASTTAGGGRVMLDVIARDISGDPLTGLGGGSGDGNLLLDDNRVLPVITGDASYPFLMPVAIANPDGTLQTAGTLNYHDNPPLVQQDGLYSLCKSWAGLPTALTFNTNGTWQHCNTYGDQFVVPALDGVALYPAAAALADNTANPTTTGIGAYTMVWDTATWDRWTGAVTVSNIASNPCADYTKLQVLPINQSAATGGIEHVAVSGSTKIYLCGYHFTQGGAGEVTLQFGSGSTCGSNTASLRVIASAASADGAAMELLTPWVSAAARAFCTNRSASVTLEGGITYVQE